MPPIERIQSRASAPTLGGFQPLARELCYERTTFHDYINESPQVVDPQLAEVSSVECRVINIYVLMQLPRIEASNLQV